MVTYTITNTRYGANLRPQASESSQVIVNLKFGTTLDLLQDTGTKWKKVRVLNGGDANREGFVSDKNLTKEKSPAITKLMASIAHYWDLFDRGHGKEDVQPYKNHVLKMWDELGDGRPPNDNTSHPDWPWSGAAISAFIRRATGYAGFKFSSGHHRYIKDSVAQREAGNQSAPFWGHRLNEAKPEVGDLVVQWRTTPRTYDFVKSIMNSNTTFKGHTDVVCEIADGYLWGIGGNNSNSVGRKKYAIGPGGHLLAENNVFMLMKNKA